MPAVAEQGFSDRALYPDRDQGPPPLGPGISGTSLKIDLLERIEDILLEEIRSRKMDGYAS